MCKLCRYQQQLSPGVKESNRVKFSSKGIGSISRYHICYDYSHNDQDIEYHSDYDTNNIPHPSRIRVTSCSIMITTQPG